MSFSLNSALILTPGEPAGVGSEIAIKAWQDLRHQSNQAFALLADISHLEAVAKLAGLKCEVANISHMSEAGAVFKNALPVLHRPLPTAVNLGQFTSATAAWVTGCIDEAVAMCLAGEASALVTCPIQKEALYAAGFSFQGHTDYLADLCHQRALPAKEVMMLVGGDLRTIPVTVHIALKDVAQALTQDAIISQAEVVHEALRRRFGIASPRIAITGLNPHAGENGSMGREEIDIIRPAIAALVASGINAFGPLPADTAFFPQARRWL